MAPRTPLVLVDGKPAPLPSGDTLQDVGGNGVGGNTNKITHKARVVTTTNITLAGSAPDTYDGISLTGSDTVLVAGNTDATENGLYTIQTLGTGANGTWVRHSDMDTSAEVNATVLVGITEGTRFGNTVWLLDSMGGLTVGSSNINFVEQKTTRRREQFLQTFYLDGQNQLTDAQVMEFTAPRAGYLVGASIRMKNARTAGSITVKPTVNGTALTQTGLNLVIDGTDTQKDSATVAYGLHSNYAVAAGDVIGMQVTTSSFAPLDTVGYLMLQLEPNDG